MDITKILSDVKAELKASLDKALEALSAVKEEVTSLDTQKLSLQAEVAKLSAAIEPLRKEHEGQRKSTREIFAEQEKAGKELEKLLPWTGSLPSRRALKKSSSHSKVSP